MPPRSQPERYTIPKKLQHFFFSLTIFSSPEHRGRRWLWLQEHQLGWTSCWCREARQGCTVRRGRESCRAVKITSLVSQKLRQTQHWLPYPVVNHCSKEGCCHWCEFLVQTKEEDIKANVPRTSHIQLAKLDIFSTKVHAYPAVKCTP